MDSVLKKSYVLILTVLCLRYLMIWKSTSDEYKKTKITRL